jgi:hypothetical protein
MFLILLAAVLFGWSRPVVFIPFTHTYVIKMSYNTNEQADKTHESNTINHDKGIVWFDLSSIDLLYSELQPTKIMVSPGDDIDTIKEMIKVKTKSSPILRDVEVFEMKLYELKTTLNEWKALNETEQPNNIKLLDATLEWHNTVSWGTKNSPLLVKIVKPVAQVKGMDSPFPDIFPG